MIGEEVTIDPAILASVTEEVEPAGGYSLRFRIRYRK
jgi:hypothetical protein